MMGIEDGTTRPLIQAVERCTTPVQKDCPRIQVTDPFEIPTECSVQVKDYLSSGCEGNMTFQAYVRSRDITANSIAENVCNACSTDYNGLSSALRQSGSECAQPANFIGWMCQKNTDGD
jgi:hypothetical protein